MADTPTDTNGNGKALRWAPLRIYRRVKEDVRTFHARDPAARSLLEVVVCYPGLHALWLHHVAHWLWAAGHLLAGRLVSHVSRFLTGVEIHPAAEIGRRVVIDHGTGVVIGETAVVGDDVLMYHGVTLGGNDPRPVARHPTVKDGVTLGANATLLGNIVVGEEASVGAGAVVVDPVPPGTAVTGNPARPVGDDQASLGQESDTLDD